MLQPEVPLPDHRPMHTTPQGPATQGQVPQTPHFVGALTGKEKAWVYPEDVQPPSLRLHTCP